MRRFSRNRKSHARFNSILRHASTRRINKGRFKLVFSLIFFMARPEAKFIVSDRRNKVASGKGFSYRPARLHIGWRAGRTALCRSQLYPPVRDYEFGYCSQGLAKTEMCIVLLVHIYQHNNYSFLHVTTRDMGIQIKRKHVHVGKLTIFKLKILNIFLLCY